EYVDTFDTRRRGCLHLTYFSHGDTRRRGMALLRIKQDFRTAGLEIGSEELPDHLPVVLEFGAAHDPERGAKILRSNRPGVELLRLHLADIASPWHGALVALCATLPPLDADDRAAVLKLAEEGPEEETVGLEGYGLDGDAGGLAGQTFAASGRGPEGGRVGPAAGARGPGGLRARRRCRRPRRADLRLERLRLGRRRPRTCPRGPVERTPLMTDATTLQLLLWVVFPYMVLAVF